MKPYTKFLKYILLPDLGNKFLTMDFHQHIRTSKKLTIHLGFIFTDFQHFSPKGIKLILASESIFPKRCSVRSRIIRTKFSKPRPHTQIFLALSPAEFYTLLPFMYKEPVNIHLVSNAFLKQSRYFCFPGMIRFLNFPNWHYKALLSFTKQFPFRYFNHVFL
jgi:hypothetical protein